MGSQTPGGSLLPPHSLFISNMLRNCTWCSSCTLDIQLRPPPGSRKGAGLARPFEPETPRFIATLRTHAWPVWWHQELPDWLEKSLENAFPPLLGLRWSIWKCINPQRLPWWIRRSRICLQCRRWGFRPWVWKIPWRRAWQPTPVFLPGESNGQRRLAGCSPWGCKESDTTEQLTLSLSATSYKAWLPIIVNTESRFTRPLSQASHVSLISEKMHTSIPLQWNHPVAIFWYLSSSGNALK